MEKPEYMRRVSSAAARNRDPILDVLKRVLPDRGRLLEVASGTGQHAAYFAPHFPAVQWQPSDPDADMFASIEAWRTDSAADNLLAPIRVDATETAWPVGTVDAMMCLNMIHIAPWAACLGLLKGAARHLDMNGVLYLYGPYMVGGKHTAPSNEAFDQSLRSRNPEWGIRNLDDVALEARLNGLQLAETVKMPANNFSVIFRKMG